jgi:uncharacterized protein (TIGR02266 family)
MDRERKRACAFDERLRAPFAVNAPMNSQTIEVDVRELYIAENEMDQRERVVIELAERVRNARRELSEHILKTKHAAEDPLLVKFLSTVVLPSAAAQNAMDAAKIARLKALAVRKKSADTALAELGKLQADLDGLKGRVRDEELLAKQRKVQKPVPPPAPPPPPAVESSPLEGALVRALADMPVQPDNRRTAARARLCAEISLHSDSNIFTGFTNDVSEGGVFVATVSLLPLGSHVDLSFSLPGGQRIEGRGEVRWVREHDDKNPEVFPGMGIRFIDIPLPAVGAIHKFTQERDPMFFPEA